MQILINTIILPLEKKPHILRPETLSIHQLPLP